MRERLIVFGELRDECHSGERPVRTFLDAPLHIFVLQSKTVTIDGCRRLSGRDRKCLPLYGAGFGLRSGRKLVECFAQGESGVSLGMKRLMQPVDGLAIDLQGADLL